MKNDSENGTRQAPPQSIDWDLAADFYQKVSMMGVPYTESQLKTIGITKEDTLLDVGCGTGRSVLAAGHICKSVTAIDASDVMLSYCKKNVEEKQLENVKIRKLDWYHIEPEKELEKHDIVLASRVSAMSDLITLSNLAKKYVVLTMWANAPCVSDLVVQLYGDEYLSSYPLGTPARDNRQFGYNVFFREIYKLGYDPNVNIMEDGFYQEFDNREDAYQFLFTLSKDSYTDIQMMDLKKRFDGFLTPMKDGRIKFQMHTRSAVIWWSPIKQESYFYGKKWENKGHE